MLLWLPAPPVMAAGPSLFSTSDQNPFIQLHTLPSPAESPVAAAGDLSLDWQFDLVNNSIEESTPGGEQIILDGESWRFTLQADYGLGPRLALGITIPLVTHRPGFMDNPIRRWHDLWGLSNTRRDDFDDDRLKFLHERPGSQAEGVSSSVKGLGDVRLTADWRLLPAGGADRSLVLRSGLKLPTGDSERLLGTGGADVSLQLLSTDHQALARWGMTVGWSVGGMWMDDGDVLDALRREFVGLASVGAWRPIAGRLALQLQLDAHSSFYDSELDVLGSSALQLAFGARYTTSSHGWVDLAFIENLFTDTTPDFAIHLRWRLPLHQDTAPSGRRGP